MELTSFTSLFIFCKLNENRTLKLDSVTFFYCIFLALIVVFGTFQFNKLDRGYRYLVGYVFIVLIFQLLGNYFIKKSGTNMVQMNIFLLLSIPFNTVIYLKVIHLSGIKKQLLAIFSGLIFIISISHLLIFDTWDRFPSFGLILQSIQILVFAFLTYAMMLNQPERIALYKQPLFWLNTGNFFFYSITFFIFAFYNQLYENPNMSIAYSVIHFMNFVMYGFFLIAIFLNQKQNRERS